MDESYGELEQFNSECDSDEKSSRKRKRPPRASHSDVILSIVEEAKERKRTRLKEVKASVLRKQKDEELHGTKREEVKEKRHNERMEISKAFIIAYL